MKNKTSRHQVKGFTLIELLVVIGIIGALAALLLPTFARAKQSAKKKVARMDLAQITTAVRQYVQEYQRMPISKMAAASLTPSCPDFTFGTQWPDGTFLNTNKIISTGNNKSYQNCNEELMAILCNLDQAPNPNHAYNPRLIPFLQPRLAPSAQRPGLGSDGVLRDPWGAPYIVTLDMNADGKCQDGFYYPLTKPTKPLFVNDWIMAWSFGPDGTAKLDPAVGPKGGENKDNILSWE